MKLEFDGKKPVLNNIAFEADNSAIIGDVVLEEGVSVWFGASVRADVSSIYIGKRSNVQDNASIHVNYDTPTIVGEDVTIGHNAVLHGCKIGDKCLIGMGSVILDKVEIGEGSVVGAAALITQGKKFPPRSLILGNPAKAVRPVTEDEYRQILENGRVYVELACKTAESQQKSLDESK